MKKFISVLIALLLIGIIIGVAFGPKIIDKYSYSKEMADMDEYFDIENAAVGENDGNLAIVLQDEVITDRAVAKNGYVYFEMSTVKEYFNEGFYVDNDENQLLYTTADDTIWVTYENTSYRDKEGEHQTPYQICYRDGDKLYMAADFITMFANYSYERFDRHLQVYTEWGVKETSEVAKKTQLRVKGGIKSPILCQLEQGDIVEILEEMETWSKVKTKDALIGYVENKRLQNRSADVETPVTTYKPEEYSSLSMEGKVCLGWHAIGGVGGNDTLDAMIKEGIGMNVIAPTWFSLTDNEGGYRSFASQKYVEKAHKNGLKVWGAWDNFNYKNETGEQISTYQVLSSTPIRRSLTEKMVEETIALGLDGINIDYEGLTEDTGVHFIQFIKELSVLCRENGIVLSIDNYVPLNFNNFYRLDIQGKVADYVIIMGYDEHWHGSGDPGSVASIDYVSGGIERTVEKVPAQKVVNALPFYMIQWKTEGTKVTDDYITLNNLSEYLKKTGIKPEWDETTCQNYAEWKEGDVTYQIWIEDEESLRVKLNVMNAQKIGGVAVWRLGYGTSGAWQLVSAYAGNK